MGVLDWWLCDSWPSANLLVQVTTFREWDEIRKRIHRVGPYSLYLQLCKSRGWWIFKQILWFTPPHMSSIAKFKQERQFHRQRHGEVVVVKLHLLRGPRRSCLGRLQETLTWGPPKSWGLQIKWTQHLLGLLVHHLWPSGFAGTKRFCAYMLISNFQGICRDFRVDSSSFQVFSSLFKSFFPQGVIAEQSEDDFKN